MTRNPWRPINKSLRPSGPPKLRVWDGKNKGRGSLNTTARMFLFGDAGEGHISFERNLNTGRFSMVAVRDGGLHVNKQGRVLVGPVAKHFDGEAGFDILLREDHEFGRRLVFEEVERG